MHITEIVLDNFKSFGRKTRIPLYDDFTTISGPNGAGKSNIIDGILFALGLARTRGMRAQRLPDLIYNPGYEDGSQERDGPAEASVEVTLDNSDGTLTRAQVVNAAGSERIGDVEEITVRRRIKETEDNYYSYYYLNGRSVNLSDIQELLAAAGITPEGYNVVMQGDVTGIINMTPHERREIIDEIAGVAEFDKKKAAAFEELETVTDRISDAQTRIDEKTRRLDRLQDEREQALEYQRLQEEREEYERYQDLAELEAKRSTLSDREDSLADLEATLADRKATLEQRRAQVERLEAELDALTAEIEAKGEEEQLEIQREMEATKGEISRLEDRIEAARERIEEAKEQRQQAFIELDRKQETLAEVEEQIRETKLDQSSIEADLKDKKAALADVKAEIEAVDTEYDQLKEKLQSLKDKRETAQESRNEKQREQDRLLDAARRRSEELETARERRTTLQERLEELDDREAALEAEHEKAERNHQNIAGVVEDLKADKQEVADTLADIEEQLAAKQQEYADLEARVEQTGADNAYGRAVTTILEADFEGVHGAVGQLGSVPDQYATACETAAGGRLANVVVDDDGVGQRAIEYLKQRNAGRATFLPLTEMEQRSLPSLPDDPGVIDFAYNLVEFDTTYAGVFSYVLGSTVVVEDIETARRYMGRYRFVTLDGDLVEQSGAMTGGSGRGSRYSFSETSDSDLERLAAAITELQDRRQELIDQRDELDDRLEAARDRRAEAAESVRSVEADLEALAEERARVEADLDETTEQIESLEEQRTEVDEEMETLTAEIESIEADIESYTAEIESIEADLADSRIPELTAEADTLREEIESLNEQLAAHEAALNEHQLEKEYAESAIEDLNEEIESAQNTIADQEDRIDELEAEIADHEATLDELEAAFAELEDELVDLKDQRDGLRETLAAAKRRRETAKDAVAETRSERDELRAEINTLRDEIASLEAAVDDYDPAAVPDQAAVTKRLAEIDEEMTALEPVNMLALDEYEEVEAELDALQDRKAELTTERDEIEARIDSYEEQKRAAFMEAFEAINEQFTAIFDQLSDGTGELVLEDEADPFEGGLTMRAEPRDKPVQRLEAMSGGEKSLTALSLIFAIQRHDPAPFYAFDEIDAFLDAANAERVGEMVDELAGEAQFVVVSHRSALLDRSERALGVTMQHDNISTVAGIELSGETPA